MSLTGRLNRNLSMTIDMIRGGDGKQAVGKIRTRIWGSWLEYGLARDMSTPFPAPAARIPISIRLIRPDDVPKLFNVDAPGISAETRNHHLGRLKWLDAGFSSCYVAVTSDDDPCYVQWLISPEEKEPLAKTFAYMYPHTEPDEMILEGAYTPEAFRGQRIMPAAMALIAERAAELGALRLLTTVDVTNIPSLKGCERAGFHRYTIKEMVNRFGSTKVRYRPLGNSDLIDPTLGA